MYMYRRKIRVRRVTAASGNYVVGDELPLCEIGLRNDDLFEVLVFFFLFFDWLWVEFVLNVCLRLIYETGRPEKQSSIYLLH